MDRTPIRERIVLLDPPTRVDAPYRDARASARSTETAPTRGRIRGRSGGAQAREGWREG